MTADQGHDVKETPTGAGGHGSGLASEAFIPSRTSKGTGPARDDREGKPSLLWDFTPPGPVASEFIADLRPVTWLAGPFGSGKTIVCKAKPLAIARCQPKSVIDGVRRCKTYMLGKNYKAVWQKIIPTHFEFWPQIKGVTSFVGGRGEDATYTIGLRDPVTGDKLELIHEFVAVENIDVEDWSKGLKGTAYYMFEADTLPKEVFEAVLGRRWRHAREDWPQEIVDNEALWPPSCVYGDLNAPAHGNWLYSDFWGADSDTAKMYIQPSGLSPQAENIKNIGQAYYTKLEKDYRGAGDDWKVDRYIHVKPGYDRSGKPVYPQYNANIHRLDLDYPHNPNLPLVLGTDQGGTPAIVFMQPWENGVLHVLGNVSCPRDEQWTYQDLADHTLPVLHSRFAGMACVLAPDPQAFALEPGNHGGTPWAFSLANALGRIGVVRPHSNLIDDRLVPVRAKLRKLAHDGLAELRINPSCVDVCDGFMTDYRLVKVKSPGSNVERYIPDKRAHIGHTMDALGYGVMVCANDPNKVHAAMAACLERLNFSGGGAEPGGGTVILA